MANNPQIASRNEWIPERKVYATARNSEGLRALRAERLVSLRLDVTDVDQIRAAAGSDRHNGIQHVDYKIFESESSRSVSENKGE